MTIGAPGPKSCASAEATGPKISAKKKTQHNVAAPHHRTKPQLDEAEVAKRLYPSNWAVLGWALVAATRVAVLASLASLLLQPAVEAFAEATGLDAMGTFFALGLGLHTVAVSGYVVFFALCDRYGWFARYKLPRPAKSMRKNAPNLFSKAIVQMLVYHGVVRVVEVYALWLIAPYQSLPATSMPSMMDLMTHFFLAFFLGEAFNYGFHRLQHSIPWMMRSHNTHHAFVETHTISAEYSDLAELAMYTALSYLSTSGLPMAVHFVTIVWKVAENQEVHSGYSFRGSLLSRLGLLYAYRTEFHDFHHLHREKQGSYGKPVYFDYWLKTCDAYLIDLHAKSKTALYW